MGREEQMKTQSRVIGGFTLIELMMVSAIIGLLASIALPKFANMIIKAKEARVRGNLGMVRSAISIYYADNEGLFPGQYPTRAGMVQVDLSDSLVPKYVKEMPLSIVPRWHEDRISYKSFPNFIELSGFIDHRFASWVYEQSFGVMWANPPTGKLSVNCTHTDSRGVNWSVQ